MGFWSWVFGGEDDTANKSASGGVAMTPTPGASSDPSARRSTGLAPAPISQLGFGRAMSIQGLERAMRELGVGPAELWSLINVETPGYGFLFNRLPIILFERHIFHRETDGRFSRDHPDISNAKAGGYLGREWEYPRLQRAAQLDYDAAMRSASWGLGQVMGFNATLIGYRDLDDFITLSRHNEDNHLGALTAFILGEGLERYLQRQEWAEFARRYNGPAYAKNSYDVRLKAEYEKFSAGAAPNVEVRAAQLYLNYVGYNPLGIDGIMGQRTRSAMAEFMTSQGNPTDADDIDGLPDGLIAQLESAAARLPDEWPL